MDGAEQDFQRNKPNTGTSEHPHGSLQKEIKS